ncbi:uncharacterized protein L969DRAFT_44183 [Mixia osmundae IAM 14324]|uniref:RRM domain-containing protein n=1 Tax=Mixia osmundae (strain CBS 9802 / IAM 14324 / JCM 22182 / KY 12970) TaxID=764103 RepID=G7E2Z3_MIXOS|nr:uncharacterized protein L969DRAFT_44183 [Mixia osmundae IAM 14324]KEI42537.1 hypothetical protein L969DRAFT_44183 [Mixia osmundae IAM 14324]GAA97174.1 hypothetical protein E5Q_03850 [Mixia osmundae IAM 14324]
MSPSINDLVDNLDISSSPSSPSRPSSQNRKQVPLLSSDKYAISHEASVANVYLDTDAYCKDADLVRLGDHFGEVLSVKVILDANGMSKGFGFILMATSEAATALIKHLRSQGVASHFAKEMYKAGSKRQGKHHKTGTDKTNLYLSNLPKSWQEEDLRNLFLHTFAAQKHHVSVLSVRLLRSDFHAKKRGYPTSSPSANESKGIGFARLGTNQQCLQAIQWLSGRVLKSAILPLQIRFADSIGGKTNAIAPTQVEQAQPQPVIVITSADAATSTEFLDDELEVVSVPVETQSDKSSPSCYSPHATPPSISWQPHLHHHPASGAPVLASPSATSPASSFASPMPTPPWHYAGPNYTTYDYTAGPFEHPAYHCSQPPYSIHYGNNTTTAAPNTNLSPLMAYAQPHPIYPYPYCYQPYGAGSMY